MRFQKKICLFFLSVASFSNAQQSLKNAHIPNTTIAEKAFDLHRTQLKIRFDFSEKRLYGEAVLSASPHFYKAQHIVLDAKNITVQKVSSLDKILDYHYDGEQIHIDLHKTYHRKDTLQLTISYNVKSQNTFKKLNEPGSKIPALNFVNPLVGQKEMPTQIWTQSIADAKGFWFPTLNSPSQKTLQEVFLTVPNSLTTLSNGTLVSKTVLPNGERQDYWRLGRKNAPYLFFMAVGEFAVVKETWRGKDINYYVDKGKEDLAKQVFGNTPQMMHFFSEISGIDFVWDQYSQVVVHNLKENAKAYTSVSVFSDASYQSEGDLVDGNLWEPVIANRLFQQWFGSFVGPKSWSEMPWNEGFGEYAAYLWMKQKHGQNAADAYLQKTAALYRSSTNTQQSLVEENSDSQLFLKEGRQEKGALVLHMLKDLLGDKAFFKGLQQYLKTYAYAATETAQLRMAFEDVSGRALGWFFDQWFFKGGHPVVHVTYDYNLLEKTVTVNLRQQGEVFYFPLEIVLHENGLKRVQQVFVKEEESSFTFAYNKIPQWVQVNADHVVLGDFIENKTQRTYMYQFKHATHVADRKEALLALSKHQEDKKVFELLVSALDDAYAPLQIIALEQIDLSNKHSKRQVVKKIESLAKNNQNNAVKAAAIKVLGKLVYFDYQYFFEKSVDSPSNAVKGSALEALYYLDTKSAMDKAKFLPSSVKKSIAIPLSKLYIEVKEASEMAFVAKYIVQGLYLSNDNKTKELYKNAFTWVAASNNVTAITNLANDLVVKGQEFRSYNFHLEAIRMLREIAYAQERSQNSHQKELMTIANSALSQLIE
jgi:aminopeptidase N